MDESNRDESLQLAGGGLLTRERAAALVLLAATALSFYVCYRLALPFLPAITWAFALAVVAHPLHARLARRVYRPNIAAGLSVAAAAVLVVTPAVFLVQQLVSQATRGAQALRSQAESGQLQAAVEGNAALSRVVG